MSKHKGLACREALRNWKRNPEPYRKVGMLLLRPYRKVGGLMLLETLQEGRCADGRAGGKKPQDNGTLAV